MPAKHYGHPAGAQQGRHSTSSQGDSMLACAPVCGVQARGRGPCSFIGGLGNGGLSGICLDGPAVHCVLLPGQLPAQLPKCGPLLFLQPSPFLLSYCPSDYFVGRWILGQPMRCSRQSCLADSFQDNSGVGLASLDPVSLQQESWWQMRVVCRTPHASATNTTSFSYLQGQGCAMTVVIRTDHQSTHRRSFSRRYNVSWFIACLCSNKGLRSA